MANPFKPGTVYYVEISETEVRENESRNNPEKGPRPWIILYCRQHGRTGLVLAAPLYTKGDEAIASHVPYLADEFEMHTPGAQGIGQSGVVKLEQLRALDKGRLRMTSGPLACMRKQPFDALRGKVMGMLEPRLLPE